MALTQQQPRRLTDRKRQRLNGWRLPVLAGVCIFLIVWISILVRKWPFTERALTLALQQESLESVHIGGFKATFFPLGYIAQNVHFTAKASASRRPETTITKLVVIASPIDLLMMRKRVERISLDGVHMTVPSGQQASSGSRSTAQGAPPRFSEIGEVDIRDSVAEFSSPDSKENPFSIGVKNLKITHISSQRSGSFEGDLLISEPQGAVRVSGQIGPWAWKDMGSMQLSGSFDLQHADLKSVGDVEGILEAKGKFAGPLRTVHCTGTANVPQFRVSASIHPVDLYTTFAATVNGLTGDTTIQRADSHLNQTVVQSEGEVKQDPQQAGKTASLRFSIQEGQIEDVLLLFTKTPQPSMAGIVDLRLDVELPPGSPGFLRKIGLKGDFGIDRGHFLKPHAQDPINQLSESARNGRKDSHKQAAPAVLSDLSGHVSAQGGVATLSHISFTIPGGHASLAGTYNLLNEGLNLHGVLRTTGKVSETTSGLKAAMLKVVTPFLKKNSVTVVPFLITGTTQHPTFALDLLKKR